MKQLPITIVTGFLGSGKTTLINRLLSDPRLADSAVIINEFGEIPLDHLLVEEALENTLVLANGCVCCTIRGDLVDTLTGLRDRASRGEIPQFSRVFVETTGLAEPAPIVQAITAAPTIAHMFYLRSIVVTVDAVHGNYQLANHAEAAKQIAAAGLIILTKTGLAPDVAGIAARLDAINPGTKVVSDQSPDCDVDTILNASTWNMTADDAPGWLPKLSGLESDRRPGPTPGSTAAHHDHAHQADHVSAIGAVALVWDTPVAWPALHRWTQSLLSLRGADVLRLKGFVSIAGRSGPRVVHAVQHLLHRPRDLAAWPDHDRRTRIMVIGRNLNASGLRRSFADALSGHSQ